MRSHAADAGDCARRFPHEVDAAEHIAHGEILRGFPLERDEQRLHVPTCQAARDQSVPIHA